MTNKDAELYLSKLGKDRKWLVEASGYSINSLNNTFAGKERDLNERMKKSFEKAFLEEERRKNIDITKPKASVWDLVMFTGKEVTRINEGRRIGGYDKVEDLYHDAVMSFADDLIAKEENVVSMFDLPLYGSAAAGEQVVSQLEDGETISVTKEYPAGYFAVEVNGQSMEPTIEDGARIVCEPKEHSPANGKICIVSDGHGCSIKRFDRKKKAFVSDNPDFPDLTPVGEVNLQGYYVETL